MNTHFLQVQQAGLGFIGWLIVFAVLVPLMSSIFKSKKEDEPPK